MLLETTHLVLRLPQSRDAACLQAFEDRNKVHWKQWESTTDNVTIKERIKTWKKEFKEGRSVRWLLFKKDNSHDLIGLCNFT